MVCAVCKYFQAAFDKWCNFRASNNVIDDCHAFSCIQQLGSCHAKPADNWHYQNLLPQQRTRIHLAFGWPAWYFRSHFWVSYCHKIASLIVLMNNFSVLQHWGRIHSAIWRRSVIPYLLDSAKVRKISSDSRANHQFDPERSHQMGNAKLRLKSEKFFFKFFSFFFKLQIT